MIKLKLFLLFIICSTLLLSACGLNQQESKSIEPTNEMALDSAAKSEAVMDNDGAVSNEGTQFPGKNQMVIYTGELNLEVKDLKKANRLLEEMVKKYEGYIVQSNTYHNGDETYSSSLTLRIPQKSFDPFLNETEKMASKVLQRNVSGTDITEEYVDLESRLKSKRAVESRLLEFMGKAETTEDLLKISKDLAVVQEEIEQISGRIKYLDNQVAFSTVTITLNENKVTVPEIDKSDFNTWEKIKKQFMTSINILLSGLSGAAVLIFGNIPILILLGIIIGVIIFFIKRKKKDE
jgi:major membrane immunogen (membrane-anchored lipoprotein)